MTRSYFCSRGPWDFLCKGPLGPPQPSEPRVIRPGVSLGLFAAQMGGEAGPGELLFATRCMLHLPGALAGRSGPAEPPLSRQGGYFKSSEHCNPQWRAPSPVEARPPAPGAGDVSGVASGGQRPAEARKVDGAPLGSARQGSARAGCGARRDSLLFGTEWGGRGRAERAELLSRGPKAFGMLREEREERGWYARVCKLTLHLPSQLLTWFS